MAKFNQRVKDAFQNFGAETEKHDGKRLALAKILIEEEWLVSDTISPKSGGTLTATQWTSFVDEVHKIMGKEAYRLRMLPTKTLSEAEKETKTAYHRKSPRVILEVQAAMCRVLGVPVPEKAKAEKKKSLNLANKADALQFFKNLEDKMMDIPTEQYNIDRVIELVVEIQGVISNSGAKAR